MGKDSTYMAKIKKLGEQWITPSLQGAPKDIDIQFNDEQIQTLEEVTQKAFKDDLLAESKGQTGTGLNTVLTKVQEFLPSVQQAALKQKLTDHYEACKKDYKETTLLGVGKTTAEKAKTLGGMARRTVSAFVAFIPEVAGIAIGETLKVVGFEKTGQRIDDTLSASSRNTQAKATSANRFASNFKKNTGHTL